MQYSYSFLILLLPFLSFLLLGLLGMKMKKPVAGMIGTAVLAVLWGMSLYTAYEYFFAVGRDASTGLYPTVTVFNFTWLKFTEALTFNIGFRLTPISVMMLIVITTVSMMVHIYSFGYMAERDENYKKEGYEKGFQRFYAFLSLFTMSMLGLVVATNIFQMYLFWELVGVCSSGSSWVYALTCLSASTIPSTLPCTLPRRLSSSRVLPTCSSSSVSCSSATMWVRSTTISTLTRPWQAVCLMLLGSCLPHCS